MTEPIEPSTDDLVYWVEHLAGDTAARIATLHHRLDPSRGHRGYDGLYVTATEAAGLAVAERLLVAAARLSPDERRYSCDDCGHIHSTAALEIAEAACLPAPEYHPLHDLWFCPFCVTAVPHGDRPTITN